MPQLVRIGKRTVGYKPICIFVGRGESPRHVCVGTQNFVDTGLVEFRPKVHNNKPGRTRGVFSRKAHRDCRAERMANQYHSLEAEQRYNFTQISGQGFDVIPSLGIPIRIAVTPQVYGDGAELRHDPRCQVIPHTGGIPEPVQQNAREPPPTPLHHSKSNGMLFTDDD